MPNPLIGGNGSELPDLLGKIFEEDIFDRILNKTKQNRTNHHHHSKKKEKTPTTNQEAGCI